MKVVQREFKAAWDRFRYWLLPPSMRRYDAPKPKSRVYRYPSVGSEPANHEFNYIDYKTAYRDSIHHIRHNVDTHKTLEGYLYCQDPITETPEEKLVRCGFLAKDQVKNSEAIQRARKQYEQEIGESVDIRLHHDDFGYSEQPITRENREGLSEYITSLFEGVKHYNATEAWLNDLDDIYKSHFFIYRSTDMGADDPVYRQLVVELEAQLDEILTNREEMKKFPVFKGDPAYWAILDDSFSAENIKRIQSSVKNFTGYTDLTPVILEEGVIPPERRTPTIDVPHITQAVE